MSLQIFSGINKRKKKDQEKKRKKQKKRWLLPSLSAQERTADSSRPL